MLVPMLNHCFTEEQGGKWDAVRFASPSGLEMVFTLLVEAIVIYVQVHIIKVEEPSFKEMFARTWPVILF